MKFNDGKTFSAYVRSKLHSGYITQYLKSLAKSISKCSLLGGKNFHFYIRIVKITVLICFEHNVI